MTTNIITDPFPWAARLPHVCFPLSSIWQSVLFAPLEVESCL